LFIQVLMDIAQKIRELAESHLTDASHFVVDVVISKHRPHKVSVFLDGDNGITIDHCSDLSRALSEDLDKLDLIRENYMLEVGTPGLDQPLKLKRQFVKNIGMARVEGSTERQNHLARQTYCSHSRWVKP
jgi:ribosome maturation factor RimP